MFLKFSEQCRLVILLILGILVLNSCSSGNVITKASEVDFSVDQNIQISFNDNIYNAVVSYNGREFELIYNDNCGAVSGTVVVMNGQQYTITYKEMLFQGETDSLPQNCMPFIIYNFFRMNGSIITFTDYNSDEKISTYTCKVFNYTISLKASDNNDGTLGLSFVVK